MTEATQSPPRLTFVTVVYELEQELLLVQARSMAEHLPTNLVDRIIVVDHSHPAAGRKYYRALLAAYGPHSESVLIAPSASLGRIPRTLGYTSQQILKLRVAHLVNTASYVVFDAKNHLVGPISINSFFTPDGSIRVGHNSYLTHPHRQGLEAVLAYFDLDLEQYLEDFTATVPPFTMHTPTVLDLMGSLEDSTGRPFAEIFLDRKFTEFLLYAGWVLHKERRLSPHFALQDGKTPTIWAHLTDAEHVRLAIAAVKEQVPVFAVHRKALAVMADDAVEILADFWTQRRLFRTAQDARHHIRHFQRRHRRLSRVRWIREAPIKLSAKLHSDAPTRR